MMHEVKELKYGNTRCYCINNKIIIDTDWSGSLPAFYRCAKEHDIKLSTVKYLIITHFHPDHMGIAQELSDIGIKITVFEEQKEYIHSSDKIFEKDRRVKFKPIDDRSVLYMSCSESRNFLMQNEIRGEVIHTVGHSEDSISLILDDGIAFVGDLYPISSVPAFHDKRLEESWNRILSHNINRIYYGHAPSDIITNITSIQHFQEKF